MGNYYILDKIIEKHEKSSVDWKMEKDGNRTVLIQQSDYDAAGRSDLLKEAEELERRKLIKVKWYGGRSDIEKITYRLSRMTEIYELAGRVQKLEWIEEDRAFLETYLQQAESDWLKEYYQTLLAKLEKGKRPEELEMELPNLLFGCLNQIEKLNEPVYVRVFSSQYLGGSKVFEKQLKNKVISVVKTHHPMVDDEMEEYQVLSQLYLETYAQELAVKGELKIELDGTLVDLSEFKYGTVLNTDTLKHARIPHGQNIQRIITVENKANYISMPYEEGTLILFCHGFFSPRERNFLQKLECVLQEDREMTGKTVEYFHTSDLDYGGVRIFQYNRTKIFPELKPFMMGIKEYEQYQNYAVEMEDSSWRKLKKMDEESPEPLLKPLISRIIEEKKVIEQECFLFAAT